MGNSEARFKKEVKTLVQEVLGSDGPKTEWSNPDDFQDMQSLQEALRKVGVESCNLIAGFDFTNSNKNAGVHSFHGLSLHALDSAHGPNPYEVALSIIGKALVPFFDDDGLIPTFIFGDLETKAHSVRQIGSSRGCRGVEGDGGVLAVYREAVRNAFMSGPTSFAPLIDKAVELTRASGNALHVLLILADGQVSPGECLRATTAAIVRASSCPLSIVIVGLGDGPWDDMVKFDDDLEQSKFDNIQFVPFSKFHALLADSKGASKSGVETAFAICALQELPAQYAAMTRLGLLGTGGAGGAGAAGAALRDRSRSPRRR